MSTGDLGDKYTDRFRQGGAQIFGYLGRPLEQLGIHAASEKHSHATNVLSIEQTRKQVLLAPRGVKP